MTNPLFDHLFGQHDGSDALFLRFEDGSAWSYAEFLETAARFAHAITENGLKPGDRLAAQVQKTAEALALYAACVQAGVVFLPLNPAYTVGEVTYFVEDSGAKMIVCDPASTSVLTTVAERVGAVLQTLGPDGLGTLSLSAQRMASSYPTVQRSSDDLAALLYTSGTTGRSKGAMLTQGNLLSNAITLAEAWRFSSSDVLLHALPIFHTHGLFVATNVTLAAGATMIFMPRFTVDRLIRLLPKATVLMGVPTFYTRLLDHPAFTRDHVAHMRLFVSGSAPLLPETHERFEARTGHCILERYGMTETNMNTSNPYCGERRAGTVGFALPGVELKIADPDSGAPVPDGTVGQIEVRGSNVFKGYWRMPEKTKADLRSDGFFITGDVGYVDKDGYVHIVGRDKDLIIAGGYNIYPREIEAILDDHADVLESAVIGIPDADLGEAVLGVLVPRPQTTPDLDDVMSKVRASIARFKHPRSLVLVDELPRNAMGKVQKNILRDRFKDAGSNV
jgi:malonyl-CoA/methylmalonyl-CoA synthetase